MMSRIKHINFEPALLEKSIWKGSTYENMDIVMERVNEWIRRNYSLEIINVETITFPQTFNNKKIDSSVSKLNFNSGYVYMIQIIRVWYKE